MMVSMNKLLLLIISLLLFSGCVREEENVNSDTLALNEAVVILKGKKIIPLSSDAKVKINKNSNESTITVTLLQGSAKVE